MTLLNILYSLIVEPLRLFIEVVFFYAYKGSNSVGFSIILLSLVVNTAVLPLYMRTDALQKEEGDIQAKMAYRIKQIKKTFKGDERFFMLQEYYRIENYKPVYALKSSVSLFLQIPFFIAAYSFLTELKLMQGASIGPISNLSMPDSLIHFGGISINVLPILMTVINIIASLIYSEKSPIKDKLKLLAIALVFLILLYNSPAGLVFYWTLNNLFSLIKNIVLHFKKPSSEPKKAFAKSSRKDMELIYFSCSVMALITGLVTPVGIISQNPEELTNTFLNNPHSPVLYLVNSLMIAIGMFMIWIPIFVYLVKGKHSKPISYAFVAFASIGVINTLLFNPKLGLLSSKLIYEKYMDFKISDIVINLSVDIIIFAIVFFIGYKLTRYIRTLVAILLVSSIISGLCLGVLSFRNNDMDFNMNSYEDISIPLSTNGKNVVVIMMDRMIGTYIPYIFSENPELKSKFDGFTYYPNTVSFGPYTNIASPALFGGYDYTPEKINERSDERLVDKQNESLLVLPTIFANEGWNVVVGDPTHANYKWYPDTSIYEGYERIKAYQIALQIENDLTYEVGVDMEERLNRNFFCYGLMRSLPYFLQPFVYSNGSYNHIFDGSVQIESMGTMYFREELALESLSQFTHITDASENYFFMYTNGLTHCDFGETIQDNSFDKIIIENNEPLYLDDWEDYRHYQTNTKACFLLGQWFDYLKENNVYDNTRIIIVADHGRGLNNSDSLLVTDLNLDAEWFNPIFMVKDFGQTGFTVSNEFMTNANTPYFAVDGIVDNPVNPFTNAPIVRNTDSQEILIYDSDNFNVTYNNGTTFKDPDGRWLVVHDNIWDDENWSIYDN